MSGLRNSVPARGAAPPARNVRADEEYCRSVASLPCHSPETSSETGKPSVAMAIAGARTDVSGSRPKRSCSAAQPATAPGTVTACAPPCGIDSVSVADEPRRCQCRRRPAACVQPGQRSAPSVVNDREEIAAHSVHHRRDDAHYGVGGERRIDGVATRREYRSPRLGCKRVLAGDDAPGRHHHRSGLDPIDDDPRVVRGPRCGGGRRGCWCHAHAMPPKPATRPDQCSPVPASDCPARLQDRGPLPHVVGFLRNSLTNRLNSSGCSRNG